MTWQIDEGAREPVIIPVLKLIDNEWTAYIRLRDTISLATSHSAWDGSSPSLEILLLLLKLIFHNYLNNYSNLHICLSLWWSVLDVCHFL